MFELFFITNIFFIQQNFNRYSSKCTKKKHIKMQVCKDKTLSLSAIHKFPFFASLTEHNINIYRERLFNEKRIHIHQLSDGTCACTSRTNLNTKHRCVCVCVTKRYGFLLPSWVKHIHNSSCC